MVHIVGHEFFSWDSVTLVTYVYAYGSQSPKSMWSASENFSKLMKVVSTNLIRPQLSDDLRGWVSLGVFGEIRN